MRKNHAAKLTTLPGPYSFTEDAVCLSVSGSPPMDTYLDAQVVDEKQLLAALNRLFPYLTLGAGSVDTMAWGTVISIEVISITPNASKQLGWSQGDTVFGTGDYADYSRVTEAEVEAVRLTRSTPYPNP